MTDISNAAGKSEKESAQGFSLVPVNADMKRTFRESRADFAQLLEMDLPEGWPEFPEAFGTDAPQDDAPWTGYLFLANGALVGNGGFVGPPDQEGTVEIGYEIAPEYRNRGHATRAVRKMIELAFHSGAKRVIAHSLASCQCIECRHDKGRNAARRHLF